MAEVVYYSVGDIAKILGWGYLRTYRWLKSTDVMVRRGNRLVTTRERLIAAFPEVWAEIAAERAEREELMEG